VLDWQGSGSLQAHVDVLDLGVAILVLGGVRLLRLLLGCILLALLFEHFELFEALQMHGYFFLLH
jgi:hypothetical protein